MKDSPNLHSVSVAGVVLDSESRVLVMKRRDNGAWQIPGGVLERDETLEDGTKREIREETGMEVDVEQLTGVYKNLKLGVVALVYRCSPIGGKLETSDESSDVSWFTLEQVESELAPVFFVRVRDAIAGGVFSRNHDGTNILD